MTCHAPPASAGEPRRLNLRRSVIDAVARAGGTPILLPPIAAHARAHLATCDAFVFTGGDDPRTEEFDPRTPTHPRAVPLDPDRQAHEVALLRLLRDESPDTPVLGLCLGMQLMALVAGGELNQCLDDDTPTFADHAPPRSGLPSLPEGGVRGRAKEDPPLPLPQVGGDKTHTITVETDHPLLVPGEVNSWHRQAVRSAGRMRVIARAHDGVIEAIDDPSRAFYLGVQWHPERFGDVGLNQSGTLADGLFRAVVNAAKS
ncbi:MAG: gamma-glutamyl-gamma-aminobutyrate hydrolase family protein [Phycisphaerales bacterium]